jgi:hypothetical protein
MSTVEHMKKHEGGVNKSESESKVDWGLGHCFDK